MTPLLLALLLVPGARAVDWSADPVASIRGRLQTAPLSVPAAASVRANAGGDFDYYVLSLEWHPTFCAGRRGLPECQDPSFDRELVMHGLWPSRLNDPSNSLGYCGVDSSIQRNDTAQTRCQMPAVPISQETHDALATKMPGVDACLERHEWYRHGTCSGLDAESYFELADNLVGQANGSRLGRYIVAHAGQTVNASDLIAQARADWGAAADGAVKFACSRGGRPALSEVRLLLKPSVQDLSGSLTAGDAQGGCPAAFLITPAN
jgi:ribonuclease I